MPRIDANDDENTNTSTTNANYKVAAEVYNGSTLKTEVRTYDNLMTTPMSNWESSCVILMPAVFSATAPYNHYSPAVSFVGPAPGGSADDGTAFMVSHFTETGGGDNLLFAEPIDYAFPKKLATGDYYIVSQTAGYNPSPLHINASAPMSNSIAGDFIVAWGEYNGSGSYYIDYKLSNTGSSYGFRQAGQQTGNGVVANEWVVYPNPASTELYVAGGQGTGNTYSITDLLGRNMAQGAIEAPNAMIDIKDLAPGNYILRLRKENGDRTTRKFVKE